MLCVLSAAALFGLVWDLGLFSSSFLRVSAGSGVSGVAWHIGSHGVGVSLRGSSEEFS